jgi:flagellar biogenesis protein FliO
MSDEQPEPRQGPTDEQPAEAQRSVSVGVMLVVLALIALLVWGLDEVLYWLAG